MVKVNFKHNKGGLMALAGVIAIVVTVLIASVSALMRANATQNNSLVWRERLYRMANDGYIKALTQISVDPGLRDYDTQEVTTSFGVYSSTALLPTEWPGDMGTMPDMQASVYVQVSATITAPGAPPPTSLQLGTFIRVANAGRFYAATKQQLVISNVADTPGADYFGRDVIVVTTNTSTGDPIPDVGRIFYSNSAQLYDIPSDTYSPISAGPSYPEFITEDSPVPGEGVINKLDLDPIFPQISSLTMNHFKNITSSGIHNSYYSGNVKFPGNVPAAWQPWTETNGSEFHIYPPGCENEDCTTMTNCTAGNSVCFDQAFRNHIYYVDGNLEIEGIVHGQVLFVASGDIVVTGDLVSHSQVGSDPDNPTVEYPGCPAPCMADRDLNFYHDASNAHQAVLITPSANGIQIDNINLNKDLYTDSISNYPPHAVTPTFTFEAMLLCPNGPTRPLVDNNPLQKHLLDFEGAFILGREFYWSNHFEYPDGEGSQYMETLATRPPPDVPGFTQLQIWRERYN